MIVLLTVGVGGFIQIDHFHILIVCFYLLSKSLKFNSNFVLTVFFRFLWLQQDHVGQAQLGNKIFLEITFSGVPGEVRQGINVSSEERRKVIIETILFR